MSVDAQELRAALEAVVFVASEPVSSKRLQEAFPDETPEDLEAALTQLRTVYEKEGRGLLLDRVAGGWRIATRPAVHSHVARFVQQEKAERLSLRTLETLSVIAYKQPVTSAEIQEIRGVDPSGTLRTLLDKGLVKIAGRKKVVGRPFVYATTRRFLETFGLDDLSELPSLRELEDFAIDLPTTDPRDVDPAEDDADAAVDAIIREAGADAEAEGADSDDAEAEGAESDDAEAEGAGEGAAPPPERRGRAAGPDGG